MILGLATGTKQVSTSLARLVCYYAELLASQGLLSTALEYIKLIPSDDSSPELSALRERISQSGQGMFSRRLRAERGIHSWIKNLL